MKKSQTATEYLIILAVVIIIALIVVGVMWREREEEEYSPFKEVDWITCRGEDEFVIDSSFNKCTDFDETAKPLVHWACPTLFVKGDKIEEKCVRLEDYIKEVK